MTVSNTALTPLNLTNNKMKLESQVCSLELAKELKELGV